MAIERLLVSPDGVVVYAVPRACARDALLGLLAAELRTDPVGLRIERNKNGKPYIDGGPEFSVAHAGERSFIALGGTVPIGIDVERVVPIPEIDQISRMFFDGATQSRLAERHGERKLVEFYRAWVALEAGVKACGAALWQHETFDPPRAWVFRLGTELIGAIARAESVGRPIALGRTAVTTKSQPVRVTLSPRSEP